jgi:microcystin-dependent protein
MTQPFLGQIQPMGFNFAPRGWATCDGQIIPITQNTALFALLGTTFGGNGQTTFGLPDLRGRVGNSFGTFQGEPFSLGEMAGTETVTLTINEMPMHNHAFNGSTSNGASFSPADGSILAEIHTVQSPPAGNYYASDAVPQPLASQSIGPIGGNQPHDNMQPYLVVNWCIATSGIFPARN